MHLFYSYDSARYSSELALLIPFFNLLGGLLVVHDMIYDMIDMFKISKFL